MTWRVTFQENVNVSRCLTRKILGHRTLLKTTTRKSCNRNRNNDRTQSINCARSGFVSRIPRHVHTILSGSCKTGTVYPLARIELPSCLYRWFPSGDREGLLNNAENTALFTSNSVHLQHVFFLDVFYLRFCFSALKSKVINYSTVFYKKKKQNIIVSIWTFDKKVSSNRNARKNHTIRNHTSESSDRCDFSANF